MGESGTADELVSLVVANKVVDSDDPLPVTVVASGGGASKQAVTVADGDDVVQGAKADAAWNGTPGSTTIVAILKAIYAKVAATLGFSVNAGTTDSTTLRVITASDGPLNTNLGATTDAAVVSDANGSVSGKIRGLVKMFADVWDSTNHGFGVKSIAPAGTPTHTADATVDGTAGGTTILNSNASRKAAMIQVVSGGNVRVSIGGTPTASTGLQLVVGGQPLIVEGTPAYGCPTGTIKAIREGSVSGVVSVLEIA